MITIFKDIYTSKANYISIDAALKRIKDGKSRILVDKIRKTTDKEARNELKKGLPSVLFSGEFKDRKDQSIIKHSKLAVIDFDHVNEPDILKRDLSSLNIVFSAWISPSGDGVKCLVKLKYPERHSEQYLALLDYFKKYGVDADEKNKNLARVCFESFDPNIYINKNSIEFDGIIEVKKYEAIKINRPETDEDKIYSKLKKWASNRGELFVEGNRNSFLMKMASACNRTGISKNSAILYLTHDYLHGSDFSLSELQRTVDGVYKNYANQHGTTMFENEEIINVLTKEKVNEEVFSADMKVEDLIYFKDVYENLNERISKGITKGETTHFKILDNHFRWARRELTAIHGFGNHGKSSMALQLMLLKSVFDGRKWAIFSPENNPADFFYQDISEMYYGGVFDQSTPKEEIKRCNDFVNDHFFYIYPEKENPTPEYILKKFMETIIKHKIDGVMIDPFNQLSHDITGRDDLYLETLFQKWKRFAQNNDIYFIIVTHPNKPTKNGSDKIYDEPDVYSLARGSMWNNKMDNILCFNRPNFFINPKDSWCILASQKIKKQKLNGVQGKVNFKYDRLKCRFYEIEYEPSPEEAITGYNPLEVGSSALRPNTSFTSQYRDITESNRETEEPLF